MLTMVTRLPMALCFLTQMAYSATDPNQGNAPPSTSPDVSRLGNLGGSSTEDLTRLLSTFARGTDGIQSELLRRRYGGQSTDKLTDALKNLTQQETEHQTALTGVQTELKNIRLELNNTYPKFLSVTPSDLPWVRDENRCPKCNQKKPDDPYHRKPGDCPHDFHDYFRNSGFWSPLINVTVFEVNREAVKLMCQQPHGWIYRESSPNRMHTYRKDLNDKMYAIIEKWYNTGNVSDKWQIMLYYKLENSYQGHTLATSDDLLGEYTFASERWGVNNFFRFGGGRITCTVAKDNKTSPDVCRVCMEKPKDIALVPCGHKCVCVDCKDKISGTCPICRTPIEGTLPAGFKLHETRRRLAASGRALVRQTGSRRSVGRRRDLGKDFDTAQGHHERVPTGMKLIV